MNAGGLPGSGILREKLPVANPAFPWVVDFHQGRAERGMAG
jgi:hypothetical protein